MDARPLLSAIAVRAQCTGVNVSLPGVPTSTFAALAFQDEDENGEPYRNFIDLPSEKYSFSCDTRGKLRPLSFEDAAIPARDEPPVTAVNLHKSGTPSTDKSSNLLFIYIDLMM